MKKSIKKVLSLALMTAMLATSVISVIPVSAEEYDNTLTLTINGTDCSTSGKNIVLYPNNNDSVRKINTSDYYFRYSKIMIFDGNGKLIEIGENMFANSPNETGSAQNYIYVPAHGFAIAFSSSVSGLNSCYNTAKEGAVFYNSTISVIYDVYGSYSGNTLTVKYDNPKEASATAKKFLFVGNSATYFNGTPIKFKGLAQSAGIDVDVTYCTYGSSYLHQYANASHDYGKGLRNVLNNEQFDYVVLQDAGGAEYEDTKPAVSTLLPLIEANGAEALLYMRYSASSTPAYRFDGARTHYINYTRLSREYGLIAAPAASAFLICTDKYPEINLYADDNSHHSKEGSYLIACVMLMSYLGVDPVGVEYDAQLGTDVARKLQECAKQACVDGYDYNVSEEELTPPEDVYYVNGNKYQNITTGKSYTSNGAAYNGDYTDHNSDGTVMGKLTNGLYASTTGSTSTIGCHKGSKVSIDIDLNGKYEIKAFKTQLFGNTGWGITDPFDTSKNVYVEFAVSNDGNQYTTVGKAKVTQSEADTGWTKAIYTLEPEGKIEARYIRATFCNSFFVWCDEISAYGTEGGNIALGMDHTVSGVGYRTGSYCAPLNDGIASEKLTYDKGDASTWFGFYNHASYPNDSNAPDFLGTVTYDFEKLYNIEKVRVHTLFGNASGIKSPQYISVETSEDGVTYNEVTRKTYSPSEGTSIEWVDLAFKAPVEARFVRVCVKLDGTFAFINEIEIYGEEKVQIDDDDEKKVNIALDKKYEISGIGNRDTCAASITDGFIADGLKTNANWANEWFGFYHNGNAPTNAPDKLGYFIIDLENEYDLSSIVAYLGNEDAWGIKTPEYVKAYTSLDGVKFEERGSFYVSAYDETYESELKLDCKARFVKVEFKLTGTFAFVSEIEVFGAQANDDDDDDDDDNKPEYTLGDVNGKDGIEKYDYIAVKRAVMGTLTLSETQQKAADVNGKDGVEKYDYILIKRHVMGTYTIGA